MGKISLSNLNDLSEIRISALDGKGGRVVDTPRQKSSEGNHEETTTEKL